MSSISGSGERILAILDLFTEARPEWTPDAIMDALGYSRPTLYRYLKTLKSMGYLVSFPGDALTLGPRVTELDFLMRKSDPLISAGAPFLKILAARYPCSVFITRWYGRKILCIASEVSNPEPRSSYPRGRPMPFARGAISRVILAHLPRREQDAIIADHLDDLGGPGTTPEEVLSVLRGIRRAGVCTAWGEITPGVVGVAAPILAGERAPIGTLSLISTAADVDEHRLDMIRRDVKDSVAAISGMLHARAMAPPATLSWGEPDAAPSHSNL
jgi:DNA-binding IclR family transcriptional regulator